MIHYLAQATQPTKYERWIVIAAAVVTAISFILIPALIILARQVTKLWTEIRAIWQLHQNNETNIATTAKVVDGVIQAQQQSPGANVQVSSLQAVRQIAADPTQPVQAPYDVTPVQPVPSLESVKHAFDAGKSDST
jgi:hypothetical protein